MTSPMIRLISMGCALSALVALSCADSETQPEPRSPHDYGKEPPRSADDKAMGADNVPPSDKLQQGPRAGSEGVQPAAGWVVDKNGVRRRREPKKTSPGSNSTTQTPNQPQ